jgi:heme-degrading monooxygenase HmoA
VIVEHAILQIKQGQAAAFEGAMRKALPLISATPGFIGIEVRPCIETPDRYLLLVRWQTLEAHTQGFRGSARYRQWKALLHHFYDPFPLVEHYGEPAA